MNNKRVVAVVVNIILIITLCVTILSIKEIYFNKIKPIRKKVLYLEKLNEENEKIKEEIEKENKKKERIQNIIQDNNKKRNNLEKELVEKHKNTNDKVVYLTFDDGPSVYTDEILNILDKYQIKATFFVVCSNNLADYSKKYIEKGHTIGLHSCSHKYNQIYAYEDNYFNDLNYLSNIIEESTGYKSKYVRFPGGSSNTVSKFNKGIITRLSHMLKEKGYKYYDWNIDSNDAAGANSEQVYSNVIGALEKNNRDAAIILMHDTKVATKDALESIIKDALNLGYTFSNINDYTPEVHHIINN